MKKKLFTTAAFIAVIFISCKKSDQVDNPSANVSLEGRIKTWAGGSGITTYTFDSQGRCKAEEQSSGTKSVYEYQPGKVLQKIYNASNSLTSEYDYELGPDGYVAKETRPGFPTFSSTRIYNNDKQLVKIVSFINGSNQVIDYFYSNGNCDSSRFSTNGIWNSSIVYTYYPDQLNSIGNSAQGVSFYGVSSKNLLKSEQYTYPDGTKLEMTVFTYEYDAKGRAVKYTGTRGGNINIEYITYY